MALLNHSPLEVRLPMDFMKMAKGKAYKGKNVQLPTMNWQDGVPRIIVDENGVVMVVHVPGMMRPNSVVRGLVVSPQNE